MRAAHSVWWGSERAVRVAHYMLDREPVPVFPIQGEGFAAQVNYMCYNSKSSPLHV